MFNIGGDDKEKLKENMEEIRNLVNSETEQEGPEAQQEVPDMPDENVQQAGKQETGLKSVNGPENLEESLETDQLEEAQEQSINRGTQRRSSGPSQDNQSSQQRGLSPSRNSTSSSNQKDMSSRQDMREHLESISSEVKKMEDGERSAGDTLFLEVDEFNQVQSMVEEMKYLSREMKDLMNNLDEGIEEDRRIEGEAEDVVEDFSERREKIHSALQ